MNINRKQLALVIPLLVIAILTSMVIIPVGANAQDSSVLTVVTAEAANVLGPAATLNGEVTDMGGSAAVAVSFDYGATTAYGTSVPASQGTLNEAGTFSVNLSNLTLDATYHYRAKATADGGITYVYGADETFTTVRYKITLDTINALPVSETTNYFNPVTITGRAWAFQYAGHTSQYHIQVDWGDGTIEQKTPDLVTSGHDFTTSFTYQHDYADNPPAGNTTIVLKLYHQNMPGADGAADSLSVNTVVVDVAINVIDSTLTYNGAPQTATIVTEPSTLHYAVTYDGSPDEPINAGTYAVVATVTDTEYTTDPSNIPTATGTLNITKDDTTTAVISSGSVQIGQPVTFTAAVTPNLAGSQGIATGTVTFFIDGATAGAVTLDANGQAAYTVSALALGAHVISAAYSGDGNLNGSTSDAYTQNIVEHSSTTTVESSLNPSVYGDEVTFTATVTGGDNPSGTVTFKTGETALGVATLENGQAACTTTALSAGTHNITAEYSGDANNAYSTGTLEQTVDKKPINVKANDATKIYGDANPEFSASSDGLANGDTIADLGTLNFNCDATATSPVGEYAINVSGPESTDNYTLTYINGLTNENGINGGKLTVEKATLTVKPQNVTWTIGTTKPTFTCEFTGFVNGNTAAVVTGSPDFSTSADLNNPVAGTYTISITGLGNLTAANYKFVVSEATGTLTVKNASSGGNGGGGGGGGGGIVTTTPPTTTPTVTPTPTGETTELLSLSVTVLGVKDSVPLNKISGTASNLTVLSSNKEVSLMVAQGTIARNTDESLVTDIVVSNLTNTPEAQSGIQKLKAFEISPDGATFSPSMVFSVNYDPAALPEGANEDGLFIASWDGSKWVTLDCLVDKDAHTVTASLRHFSSYVLFVPVTEVAPIVVPPTTIVVTSVPPANVEPTTAAPQGNPAGLEPGFNLWLLIAIILVVLALGGVLTTIYLRKKKGGAGA